jgi:ferredoxin
VTEDNPTLAVNGGHCQGHGRCYNLFPDLFECADDDGHAQVLEPNPSGAALEHARRAVRECPERAITLA